MTESWVAIGALETLTTLHFPTNTALISTPVMVARKVDCSTCFYCSVCIRSTSVLLLTLDVTIHSGSLGSPPFYWKIGGLFSLC